MIRSYRLSVLSVGLLAMLPAVAFGQDAYQYPSDYPQYSPQAYDQDGYEQEGAPPTAQQMPPPNSAPQQTAYSQQQIDQMIAPIALYPDPLVSQILMAATYPLDIVEASRWLKEGGNAQLAGDQLAAAVEPQHWDPSVKSLAAFPQVIAMMDQNLQWTEQLGDAFLAQQAQVMDSVQHLRVMAQSAGHLQSTPQQVVENQQGAIVIMPAQPDVVYVPAYNPTVVYGAWPYPAYQPYYFPPPPGYYYASAGILSFGIGIAIADALWGWDRWDWHHHDIIVDHRRFEEINRGRPPRFAGNSWQHDPAHRHGVPYNSTVTRARFQTQADNARRNSRGFADRPSNANSNVHALTGALPAGNTSHTNAAVRGSNETPHAQTQHNGTNGNGRSEHNWHMQAPQQQPAATPKVAPRNVSEPARDQAPAQQQPHIPGDNQQHQSQAVSRGQAGRASPVFESFSRGPDVRSQSQRGATSRASTPAAAPQEQHHEMRAQQRQQQPQAQQVQQQHAAPAGGGNAPHGNGGGNDGHDGGHDGGHSDNHR